MTTPLDDLCNQLVREYREELPRADEHRRRTPLIWSLMRQLADQLGGPNVVSLPTPGAKP